MKVGVSWIFEHYPPPSPRRNHMGSVSWIFEHYPLPSPRRNHMGSVSWIFEHNPPPPRRNHMGSVSSQSYCSSYQGKHDPRIK